MRLFVASLFSLELVAIAAAQTAFEKPRLARVMWSAFQCATYADYAQDNSERARLIEIGLKAGREFLEAAKAGQITPEAGNAEVPEGPFLGPKRRLRSGAHFRVQHQ